jgi:LPS export ABC transporter protein LptC
MNAAAKYFSAVLVLGCFFICACENDPKEFEKFTTKKTAIEEAKQVESFLSQDGKVKAKLTAPFMLRHITDSTFVEFPNTLHVDFYNDTLEIESQLDALYGKYREWEKKVYLRDSVKVINKINGDTLYSPDLWWDQQTQKIYTDKPVRIYTKDKIIFGQYGLTAAQDFSEYVINQASGTLMTKKDSFP